MKKAGVIPLLLITKKINTIMPVITLTIEDVKLLQKVRTDFESDVVHIRDAKVLLNRINSKLGTKAKTVKRRTKIIGEFRARVRPQQ